MPWSGGSFTRTNGVHTGSTLWVQDRDAGTKILATRHDTHDQDLADGINLTLEKSGSNAATGDLDIGSNRITLVADGTATQDVATINQIQSNAPAFQATDTGTANAYVIALSPSVAAYAAGQAFTFKAANASTTASTLNVNTVGVKAIKKLNDQDIASGDIESGSIVTVVYDGTSFQMTSQTASAGGQPLSANLTAIAGLTSAADKGIQYTGSETAGTFDLTAAAKTVLDDATVGAMLTTLGGQPLDASLTDIAAITQVDGDIIMSDGTDYVAVPRQHRNLIINGSMIIDQRGALTGLGTANAYTTCDRWQITLGTAGEQARMSTTRNTSVLAGSGQSYSLYIQTTTAESAVASGELVLFSQKIEAQNLQLLLYGTAGAKTLTLSFDYRSPKTGTHCVALYQPDAARSFVREFTIAQVDIFEHFVITFPGDASGVIDRNTGAGLQVAFPLVAGTNWQATKDAWGAGEDFATSSQQNLLDSTSNNWLIGAVQLEVGSIDTPFENLTYAEELEACQRYYQRWDYPTANTYIATAAVHAATVSDATWWYKSAMRAVPTIDATASHFEVVYAGNVTDATGIGGGGPITKEVAGLRFTTASVMTAGQASNIRTDGTSDRFLALSAEL